MNFGGGGGGGGGIHALKRGPMGDQNHGNFSFRRLAGHRQWNLREFGAKSPPFISCSLRKMRSHKIYPGHVLNGGTVFLMK